MIKVTICYDRNKAKNEEAQKEVLSILSTFFPKAEAFNALNVRSNFNTVAYQGRTFPLFTPYHRLCLTLVSPVIAGAEQEKNRRRAGRNRYESQLKEGLIPTFMGKGLEKAHKK